MAIVTPVADRTDSGETIAGAPLAIRCRCGLRLRGQGLDQALGRCPRCGSPLGFISEEASAGQSNAALFVQSLLDLLSGRWLAQRARRWFTVPRLIFLTAAVLVGLTAWWSWQSYRYRVAIAELVALAPQGEQALERGDLNEAVVLLRQAAPAGRIVGVESATARKAIQLAGEAELWRRLAPTQLDGFFTEADLANAPSAVTDFDASFGDRTMIFDGLLSKTTATPAPNGDGPGAAAAKSLGPAYEFDWLWLDGSGQQVSIDLNGATAFARLDLEEPQRVLFGAEVDRLEPVAPGGTQWKIRVKPESVALLTAAGPFRAANWPDEASWQQVLVAQRARLGIEE